MWKQKSLAGRYYKGEITRVNSDGTYDIRFDDGERKRGVRDDQIKGSNDDPSSSRQSRREGDRVEAKVAGWTRYYKGEITRVNSDGTYDIRFDDGERKRGVRDDQIKDGMINPPLHHRKSEPTRRRSCGSKGCRLDALLQG